MEYWTPVLLRLDVNFVQESAIDGKVVYNAMEKSRCKI
jgi:hypothetical protein